MNKARFEDIDSDGLVSGGQGRTADEVKQSAGACGLALLIAVALVGLCVVSFLSK